MMVNASLKKVVIKNFKSLHDCEIDIGKLNVMVGANASGKSNLVEAFRLLKKIYVDEDSFPFLEWWGYNNVVWQRKEELPIIIGLLFDIEGYDVYFETNFTGTGGKFQILRELLDIKGYLKFEKKGEWIAAKHDVKFIDVVIEKPQEYNISSEEKKIIDKQKNNLAKQIKISVRSDTRLLEVIQEFAELREIIIHEDKISYGKIDDWEILAPVIFGKKDDYSQHIPIYDIASEIILSSLNKLLILYPLNIRSMKNPQPLRREETIKEDGSNIASVYHTIYLKEGKIPEEIYNPFTMVFPKIDVRPHITDDGRVMIKFFEDGLELSPPNTSDGFYKILTVLVAIYLKPPLLIIDEIENSLHPSTLELILDTIKIGDTQTIITTHSPIVVDMTELSNIILVEKEQGESKFKRIKDPEKIKEFLIKKGITFSEGWIYGDLFKTEQQA
ncbi:DNA replication and repair protein RecF [uncultured archaeon]|nr:DNA replication and repair protein RecF [uncultured archaeon]